MKGKETRQALYRKYRSRSLDEVVGQSQVTDVLRRGLAQGKVAHAYLLTGPRGVGKTSIARILAHEINQLPYDDESTHLDIIEIDAASNNGVDDVRDLREKVQLAPVSAAKKIYIIDEVHMLSKPAFNALLKTLEEPPEHVVFILATTDLHKVPATIISRTQHFAFHSISPADLQAQLRKIADAEGMKIADEAIAAIAERGDGSFRDSISLLDQLSSFADESDGITLDLVETSLGLAKEATVHDLLNAVATHDVAAVVSQLTILEQSGIQPTILADQLITAIRLQLAERPQVVTLLDALLDVAPSSQPGLKLLTVLVAASRPKTTTAATSAVQPAITLPVPGPRLVTKPTKATPARVTPGGAAPTFDKISDFSKEGADQAAGPESSDLRSDSEGIRDDGSSVEVIKVKEESARQPAKRKTTGPITLDWEALLQATKANIALYTVLGKCDYELDGDTLTLYTGRKFNKTKLDDVKYIATLQEALAKQGADGLLIVTVPTAKPPADEKLAAIAAMMGGGQEVVLDE